MFKIYASARALAIHLSAYASKAISKIFPIMGLTITHIGELLGATGDFRMPHIDLDSPFQAVCAPADSEADAAELAAIRRIRLLGWLEDIAAFLLCLAMLPAAAIVLVGAEHVAQVVLK
jgi:hypothetical protein